MFQLFCYKKSKYNIMKLMKRERKAPEAYDDTIIEHGRPVKVITDNAKVLTNKHFCTVS